MADLSWLGAAGTPEPTSDLPPARSCGDTGPGEHSPHFWRTAGHRYFCPGVRAEPYLDDVLRNVPEAERVTASAGWRGTSNPLDDLVAYQAAGYPGLSAPREREVAPAAHLVERIRAFMARRPLVLVHDQAAANALAGTSAEPPGLGIALVVDDAIPAGTALVVDRAKLAEALNRWATEQAIERPQLPLRLAAFPPATVAEPGTIGWAALITGV